MDVVIVNIGDELLIGQVVNTNASWMAGFFNENGMRVREVVTVGDEETEIAGALQRGLAAGDVVLLTGGLGPTKDDITKKTLCKYFDTELVLHEGALRNVEEIFAKRGYPMTERNREQAMVPACCEVLLNRVGTAPGMWFERENKVVVSLPGVPAEMKWLMVEEVVPKLRVRFGVEGIYHRTILTFGIGESFLADRIADWEGGLPDSVKLAYLPKDGMVRLRLSGYGADSDAVKRIVDAEVEVLRGLIKEYIYGEGDDTLEGVLGKMLKERGLTIGTVESCTGGGVARLIASVAGASAYFKGSVVAYSNEVKEGVVGVRVDTIEKYKAVSEETVREMAIGGRRVLGCDVCVATTGVAGPSGDGSGVPVGTVWIGVAWSGGVVARKYGYGGERASVVARACNEALRLVQLTVEDN